MEFVFKSESGIVPEMTLESVQKSDQRVFIFYHNSRYLPYFQGNQMVSYWPNAQEPNRVTDYASHELEVGRPNSPVFFVSQMVMTEDGRTIAKQPFKGLRRWESKLLKPLKNWVREQHAGDRVHGVNFILMDFITEDWVKDIVEVNWRSVF